MKHKTTGVGRRGFLMGSAAALLAGPLGLRAAEQKDAPEVKLGIVGAGGQGRGALMRSALRIPGVRFTAVCDIRESNLQAGLKMAGKQAKGFKDYRELLDKADMDAVFVAAPLHMHAEVTIAAFQAGKHVFCEKAMARTIEQCKAMLRAQKKAGKLLQIGHHLRYSPLYHHAASQINKGLLGKITNVHAQWNRHGSWRRRVPKDEQDYARWGYPTPEHLANWRLYRRYSGGLMTELASHQLDVMNWLLGGPPLAITGIGGRDYWQQQGIWPKGDDIVWDNVHVIYEYPNDVKFTYESITTNRHSPYGEAWEIIQGDNGAFVLSNVPRKDRGMYFLEPRAKKADWIKDANTEKSGDQEAITLDAQDTPDAPKVPGQQVSIAGLKKSTYQLELEDFVGCLRTGRKPFCDGWVGFRSAVPALVGLEAMDKRTRIEIPKDFYEI